jgi:membrane associated rhomboid family serine protease
MFSSIWYDVKRQFSYGNMLTRIILVNIGVFVVAILAKLIMMPIGDGDGLAYQKLIRFFMVGADWQHNLTHPWVFITHMFLHTDFWHILWNMLLLYWFGRIVGDLLGDRRILPIYLLGGLAGGVAYFIMANVPTPWDFGAYALGASAPDYNISLLFLGDVKLKYIVAVLFLLDIIGLSNNNNSGGSFGHLGGALMGYIIAHQLQHGTDLTAPVNNVLNSITSFFSNLFSKRAPGPKMAYKNPKVKSQRSGNGRPRSSSPEDLSHQEKLDAILDKIKQTGYDSLSPSEKEFLFNASKK